MQTLMEKQYILVCDFNMRSPGLSPGKLPQSQTPSNFTSCHLFLCVLKLNENGAERKP